MAFLSILWLIECVLNDRLFRLLLLPAFPTRTNEKRSKS